MDFKKAVELTREIKKLKGVISVLYLGSSDSKTLKNVEVHLVSIVVYNETKKINLDAEDKIREQIKQIIEARYREFDNTKIDIVNNPILGRITYIVFPIWKLEELIKEFQRQL